MHLLLYIIIRFFPNTVLKLSLVEIKFCVCFAVYRKKKDSGASVLGKMWQEMIIAAIGEAFEEPDVAGISICIRRNEDLISVWNGDNRNDAIRFRIGEKIKQVLIRSVS